MVGYRDKSDVGGFLQFGCGGDSNALVVANGGVSPISPNILVPLARIKSLRENVIKYIDDEVNDFVDFEVGAINRVIALIDKLIAEAEG